jgi:hypothetical protein
MSIQGYHLAHAHRWESATAFKHLQGQFVLLVVRMELL